MKRMICLVLLLSALLQISASAKSNDFYYYGYENQILNEALQNEEFRTEMHFVAKVWLKERMPELGEIDPDKISFNYDEIHCFYALWTTDVLQGFLKSEDRAAYLKEYAENNPDLVVYDVPCYYDGTRTPLYMRFVYDLAYKKYIFQNNFFESNSTDELRQAMVYENRQMLKDFLGENGYDGWNPILTFKLHRDIYFLVAKDGHEALYSMGTLTYRKEYPDLAKKTAGKIIEIDQMMPNFKALDQKVDQEVEQQKQEGTYGMDRMVTSENAQPISLETSEAQDAIPRLPWLWIGIVGGAVALVALILVFALKKKKV